MKGLSVMALWFFFLFALLWSFVGGKQCLTGKLLKHDYDVRLYNLDHS